MEQRSVHQGIAEEKDRDAPSLPWVWKSLKRFQDPCVQQKLRKTIDKATRRRYDAIAFAALQRLYYFLSVLDEDSPLSLMIFDRLPPLVSVLLAYTIFLLA